MHYFPQLSVQSVLNLSPPLSGVSLEDSGLSYGSWPIWHQCLNITPPFKWRVWFNVDYFRNGPIFFPCPIWILTPPSVRPWISSNLSLDDYRLVNVFLRLTDQSENYYSLSHPPTAVEKCRGVSAEDYWLLTSSFVNSWQIKVQLL